MCRRVCVYVLCKCVCISRVHAHRGCGHSSTNHSKWLLLLALSPVFSALSQYLIRLSLSSSSLWPFPASGGSLCKDSVTAHAQIVWLLLPSVSPICTVLSWIVSQLIKENVS